MILIADGGSTKIDWRVLSPMGEEAIASAGFNPNYQETRDFEKILYAQVTPRIKGTLSKIAYYGTGVSSLRSKEVIASAFRAAFPDVKEITVEWDMLGASRALCGRKAGVACILGTGSNSCLFDGESITFQVANLGWILADEGSGVSIGKKFLFDFLRKKMPPHVEALVAKNFDLKVEGVIQRVYVESSPGAYIASFLPFICKHVEEPYFHGLIRNSFIEFYEEVICRYPDYKKIPVSFCGSIGHHFSSILRTMAAEKGFSIGTILKSPIDGLVEYHRTDLAEV